MPIGNITGAQSIIQPAVCTSTTRPASPYTGQVIFETDTSLMKVWLGSAWSAGTLHTSSIASGGTGVLAVTVSGTNYNWTSFISTGSFVVTNGGLFEVLLFGGGGSGMYDSLNGGGGGAGGISRQTINLAAGTYTVTIGAGGGQDASGTPSSIGSIPNAIAAAGGNYTVGGSGGPRFGLLGPTIGGSNGVALGSSNVQGFVGGNGQAANAGGGGGGTTAAGSANSGTTGGVGGTGYDVSQFIGGSALFKGAGGGGGGVTGGAGGSGVGATGGSGAAVPASAAANTASGGGGRGSGAPASGSTGGSGIVYIRWRV